MGEVSEPKISLSVLLSQALIAFTIEFDNEFEQRMPHRTSRHGVTPGATYAPYLVSMAMWSTCMRFVVEDGITVGELERCAGMPTNLGGMERWRFVTVAPDPADTRANPPRADWVIRATPGGRQAQAVWEPLFREIEGRWEERFGREAIDRLRDALWDVIVQIDRALPDCLPILGYGLFCKGRVGKRHGIAKGNGIVDLEFPLSSLLSQVLLAFALGFERRSSDLSLAVCANVVRVLDASGVRVRDLPGLSGVSKEAISMATGYLEARGYAVFEPEPGVSRGKVVRLTPQGLEAQQAYRQHLGDVEARWRERFGGEAIDALREALTVLVGQGDAASSPLYQGLMPYPSGWRAKVRAPDLLPHFPMVLHRGGWPDGS